jgi:hypothetical protein
VVMSTSWGVERGHLYRPILAPELIGRATG